jgi:glycine reductase
VKEIERAGLPAVVITAMTSVALAVGANRIVAAGRIPHPTGDPSQAPEHERAWRRGVIQTALKALSTPVEKATVFSPDA